MNSRTTTNRRLAPQNKGGKVPKKPTRDEWQPEWEDDDEPITEEPKGEVQARSR